MSSKIKSNHDLYARAVSPAFLPVLIGLCHCFSQAPSPRGNVILERFANLTRDIIKPGKSARHLVVYKGIVGKNKVERFKQVT